MALGYIISKTTAKLTKTQPNIPIILTLSIIPDADILLHGIIEHRGPTHSIITILLAFLPLLVFYRKRAIPYLLAILQHSLIGDYIGGGQLQLFWPLSQQYYGIQLKIESPPVIALETASFLIMILIMYKTRDLHTLFQPRLSNLILAIPTFTVLLPTFLSYPLNVPLLLIPPHLAYMAIFLASLTITTYKLISDHQKPSNKTKT